MDLAAAAAHWTEHGFVILPSYLTSDEIAPARAALPSLFPTAEEFHDGVDPARDAWLRGDEFAGIVPFPFPDPELSLLAVHPKVMALAAAVLGTEDVRLYSCEAWAKYAGAADYEQAHHRDFAGHTPLVPSDEAPFRTVEIFVYLSDVTEGCAPTRYVSKALTRDLPTRARPHWYLPDERRDLYEAEVSAAGPAGTVVAFSIDTMHRAVGLTDPRGARFTLMPNYRAGAAEWTTRYSWGKRAQADEWHAFVERASYEQLLAFGFPPAGHPYWTPATLAGVAERYPGLDMGRWRADT